MSLLLIAAQEAYSRERLVHFFCEQGHTVTGVGDGDEALALVQQQRFDVVLTEVHLPGQHGLDVLHAATRRDAHTVGMLLAGPDDVPMALQALKQGVWDYVLTPSLGTLEEISLRVQRALEYRGLRQTIRYLRDAQPYLCNGEELIAQSSSLKALLSRLTRAAMTTAPVLLTGEAGTGKSLLAAAIHARSARREQDFVIVHCAGCPEDWLERQLFGHEKGAFPGANQPCPGAVEHAHRGTLFLHHVGYLAPTTQLKLYRLLQTQTFERLGSRMAMYADVRIVVAAHEHLAHALREGRFRPDLYARLSGIRVDMPALRDCREDILPLAYYFLQRYARLYGRRAQAFDGAAQTALPTHHWPGNLRELEHSIARAVLLEDGELVRLGSLGLGSARNGSENDAEPIVRLPPRGASLREIEQQALLQALQRTDWVQKDAAVLLDISPRVIHYKLRMHGITHPKWTRRR